MITGKQIREARALLGWALWRVAHKAKFDSGTVRRAEASDGEPQITIVQAAKIEAVFRKAGIEFIPDSDGGGSARLRTTVGSK